MPCFKWQADTCWSKFRYDGNEIAHHMLYSRKGILHEGGSRTTSVIMATRVKQTIKVSSDFTHRESERDQLEDGLDGEEQREHQVESTEHIGEGQRGTVKL